MTREQKRRLKVWEKACRCHPMTATYEEIIQTCINIGLYKYRRK